MGRRPWGRGAGAVAWAGWGLLVLPVFLVREGTAGEGGCHTKQVGIGVFIMKTPVKYVTLLCLSKQKIEIF